MRMIVIMMMVGLLVCCRAGAELQPKPDDRSCRTVFRGADQAPSADSASLADLKWFEVFKDEQLQQLIRDGA